MRSNRYHMPDFVKGGTGYMQDIAIGPNMIVKTEYARFRILNLEFLIH